VVGLDIFLSYFCIKTLIFLANMLSRTGAGFALGCK
jgi:hypothetical protein